MSEQQTRVSSFEEMIDSGTTSVTLDAANAYIDETGIPIARDETHRTK